MKKLGLILVMFVLVMGFSSNAYAIIFTSTINPFIDVSYDGNSTSGTARVDFFSDLAFDAGRLEFGNSPGIEFVMGTIQVITPGGWGVAESSSGFSVFLESSAGTPATTNHLAFEFKFKLINPVGGAAMSLNDMAAAVNTGALWSDFFSSNAPWSMNSTIFEDLNNYPTVFSSTSTTLVPEPGTVILLGFGLLGLGFFTRRRRSDS